jgi:hypothetical protein
MVVQKTVRTVAAGYAEWFIQKLSFPNTPLCIGKGNLFSRHNDIFPSRLTLITKSDVNVYPGAGIQPDERNKIPVPELETREGNRIQGYNKLQKVTRE